MSETESATKEIKKTSKVKECFEDGCAEINGRKYTFGSINHKTRLKIFGYAQSVKHLMVHGDYSFMSDDSYSNIEDLMFSNMIYDKQSLSKLPEHFNEFGEDYLKLVNISMMVFCYPFMKGNQ